VLAVSNVGSSEQLYLVESDGLAHITATQAALDLASSATAKAYPGSVAKPVTVSPAAATGAPVARQPLPDGTGVPASPPKEYQPASGEVPCVAYSGTSPSLVWTTPLSGSAPDLSTLGVSAGAADASLIDVAAGGGALVSQQGTVYLVTGEGVKFPLPNSTAVTSLGYRAGAAVQLPAALLDLLPTGPSLDLAPLQEPE
jgi:hypothetical protein